MIRPITIGATLALTAVGLTLGGCVQAQGNLQADFGASVRQNIAAQVADPDAHYRRVEQPAPSGPRTALAQERYNKGKVIQPAVTTTSSVASAGAGAGAGGSGGDGKQ